MKLAKSHRRALALLFVLLCAWWGAHWTLRESPGYRGESLRSFDGDTHYFVSAWDETPRFTDTLKWWVGPWGQKGRPFYRPLSSLFFWTQYRLFGVHGKFAFTVLLLCWHLVALLVLWRFLEEMLGALPATLASGVWAACVLDVFIMPTPGAALSAWKDTVECWHAIPHLLCLWCFLRFLRRGNARYKWLALFWFFVALLFKEMAYTAPLLLLLLAWHEGRLREKWRDAMPFFVLAAAMVAFRFWALQGTGFRMGANTEWPFRFFGDIGGGPGTRLLHGDFFTLAAVCLLLALWQALERQWRRAIGLVAAALALLAATGYLSELGFVATSSRLLLGNEWSIVPALAALLFLWWRCLKNRRRSQLFGALWAILAYLPLLSGPNTAHVNYFVAIGWAIWFAYALLDLAALAQGALTQYKLEPRTA